MTPRHVSVLPAEVLSLLAPAPGEVWVDATTGAGGMPGLLPGELHPRVNLSAIDQDPTMYCNRRGHSRKASGRFIHANSIN